MCCGADQRRNPPLIYKYQMPALDVVLATAAAPTYFQAAEIKSRAGSAYNDGGVWANSPALVGIVEAVHFLGRNLGDIDLLSIGTTEEHINFVTKKRSGILGWNKGIVDIMMAGQVSAAQSQAKLPLGNSLHRVTFQANRGDFTLDDARSRTVQSLAALGRSVARTEEHRAVVRTHFLNGMHAAPFVPVQSIDP